MPGRDGRSGLNARTIIIGVCVLVLGVFWIANKDSVSVWLLGDREVSLALALALSALLGCAVGFLVARRND